MKKQIISSILAVLLFASATAFVGCEQSNEGSNDSTRPSVPSSPSTPSTPSAPAVVDTYKGKVLSKSYASKTEAVQGFLLDEINGAATEVAYVSEDSLGEIPATEYSNYDLGDIEAADILSIERVKVSYLDGEATLKKEVGIVTLSNATYRLLALPVVMNAPLTNDYFQYIKDATLNAQSVTITMAPGTQYTSKTSMSFTMGDTSYSMESIDTANEMRTYITPDVYYAYSSGTTVTTSSMEPTTTNNYETELYVVRNTKNPAKFIQLMKTNGQWTADEYMVEYTIPGIPSTDPRYLLTTCGALELGLADHSYFERTQSGFTMNAEKENLFFDNVLSSIHMNGLGNMDDFISGSGVNMTFTPGSRINYTVRNNRVHTYDYDMTVQYNTLGMVLDMKGTVLYSNYGTTTVTVPSDVQAAIDAFLATYTPETQE